jgi:hypothetical protein
MDVRVRQPLRLVYAHLKTHRIDHVTLGPLKILGPFAQRTCEICLWKFSAAECEHDRKKNCDCNGDDNEAYTDE